MSHYREAAPPGPWVGHRHGPPPSQPFIPVSHHHEDLWHAHEERALQAPPASQAPPPPASISPTSDSGKHPNRRSRKSERPLPTKTLPASSVSGMEASSTPSASKADTENASVHKGITPKNDRDSVDVAPKPAISDASSKDALKDRTEKDEKSPETTSQLPPALDQKVALATTPAGGIGPGSSNTVPSMGATSGVPVGEGAEGLPALLPGRVRKGKELAPKELIIEIDHNKYKCQVPGCDKSFRKESGLEYHIKYYHEQKDKTGMKRKKTVSVRSDSTPDTSPEFGSYHRVPKRRIHRSSAPAQLSTASTSQLSNPLNATAPATIKTEPAQLETESSDVFMSVSMDSEPSVNQDTDLEIEGGSAELESIDPGMVECMEVEEEEDVNGDVIRCLCNESEEGGFMIQCEQCLTWQHSECVGLSEQTVPPNYICYVCVKPRGLRKSAKYKNDFDWFRRGTLACMPFTSIAEPEYTAELNLATHGLMSDVHDVNRSLRSLKLKFELLRNPSHPDLKCWQGPRKRDTPKETLTKTGESTVQTSTDAHDSIKDSTTAGVIHQGESSRTVCTESKGHAVINGHAEPGESAQNGLTRVKQERPSTPPPRIDGPGDTNNNIQDKKAPVLNTGSSLMSAVPASSGSFSASSQHEARVDSSEGRLGVVKKEEEPLSPIPALVPVGDQTGYMKSGPSSDQGKPEGISNTTSDNSQPSVKPESDREETGKSVQLKPSVGSSKADGSQVKAPTGASTPQLGSDSQVKQENESMISTQSTASASSSDVKTENQESAQSMSDDESVGAINNLLDDITQIQDDLESRMDEIEQQLTVLEEAYGSPAQAAKKTDFRKLVRDLSRVRRLLQQAS
ncbi:hypothetical protein ACROYT_G032256 [Oculina patagonica]